MKSKTRVITLFLVLFSIIFTINGCASWSLVYENDENGLPISGSIVALRNAIRRGADVKVSVPARVDDPEYVGFIPCDAVYVNHDGSVACFSTRGISVRSTLPGANFGFQDNAFHYFFAVHTMGQNDNSRWSVGEHTDRGHTQGPSVPVKWFIDR